MDEESLTPRNEQNMRACIWWTAGIVTVVNLAIVAFFYFIPRHTPDDIPT